MRVTYEILHNDLTQRAPVANWINVGMPVLSGDANRAFRRGMHDLGFGYTEDGGITEYHRMLKHNSPDIDAVLEQLRGLAERFEVSYTEQAATYTTWTDVYVTSSKSGMTLPPREFRTRAEAEAFIRRHGFDGPNYSVEFIERRDRDDD